MSEIKPKPCPFCGSASVESYPKGERQDGKAWHVYYIKCTLCECTGPLVQIRNINVSPKAARAASIDLWNWRANDHR